MENSDKKLIIVMRTTDNRVVSITLSPDGLDVVVPDGYTKSTINGTTAASTLSKRKALLKTKLTGQWETVDPEHPSDYIYDPTAKTVTLSPITPIVFQGQNVASKQDVNTVTKTRILALFNGDQNDQLKALRKAVKAMYIKQNQSSFNSAAIAAADTLITDSLALDATIERYVSEAATVKSAQGWT